MFSWSHFFIGLLVVALGTLVVKYNYQIVGYTGPQDWLESKLGGGSTYWVYKLLGLVAIVVGFLYASGLLAPALGGLLAPLRSLFGRH